MKGQNLKPEHHIVRYIPFGKLRKDENDKPIGINHNAFLLRPDETGLSVTWLEYFFGDRGTQVRSSVLAIRASNMHPTKKSGFAIGNVKAIVDACQQRQRKIRIIHWPEDDNKAHAEVRQLPRDDTELLEEFAASVWSELVLNASVEPIEDRKPAPDEPATQL
jgi:hypothetical protein